MNGYELQQRKEMEDLFLCFSQDVTDMAFERYASGDLTQEQLLEVYRVLSKWTQEAEKLLLLLN
jgi:hypothetical protein